MLIVVTLSKTGDRKRQIDMTLAPLLNAPAVVQVHAFAAMAAFALGALQLAAPKGPIPHRAIGWIGAALMLVVSAASLFIHEIRLWGSWSPIHLLSIFVLVMVTVAVMAARAHRIPAHARGMTLMFIGALVIAGAFTFLPGRIMHQVAFGP